MDGASESAEPANPPRANSLFRKFYVVFLLIANLLFLAVAWKDHSWLAYIIAVMVGPIVNGTLVVIGLLAIPFLRRDPTQFSFGRHLVLTVGVPVVAVAVDAVAIFSMDLQGH